MTQEKIITIKNIDATVLANTVLYKVPVGNTFKITDFIFETADFISGSKTTNVNMGIVIDGKGAIIDGTEFVFEDINSFKKASVDLIGYFHNIEAITGDEIKLQIDTPSDAEVELFNITLIGLIEGTNITSDGQAYTDIATLENYLGITIPVGQIDQYNGYIQAMSRYMDNYCNRVLFDDVSQTFKYDGDGSDLILIKDVCDITEVTLDGKAVEFFKYPQNKPYASRIRLNDNKFTCGIENVTVTGIQAMSATLKEDIKHACTVLVAGIHNAKNAQGKVGTTERINNYSITYKDDAQRIDFETAKATLTSYKRIAL